MTPNIGEDNSTTSSKALDAIELRIGSFYNHVKAGVIKLEADWISYFAKYPELLSGLPLNEEWLLRLGASKSFENWQYTIPVGAITLHFRCNTEWYSELGGIYLGSKIKYVHQLQNLYFALTNSELTLKEKL
jgi:hypothetical protein